MEYTQERFATFHDYGDAQPSAPVEQATVVVPLAERDHASPAATQVMRKLAAVDPGRVLVALRADGDAVADVVEWIDSFGFDGSVLWCTAPEIGEALEELVRNALEHGDRNTPTVGIQVAVGEQVTVTVTDDGPGMAEMDRDVLETGAAVDDLYHGSGLGLWLVYWSVRRSDGVVTVSDSEPRGTSVEITLPRHASKSAE